ncbi:MAG TPA: hypothetical protein VM266_01940 [Solirubrobacteraceae bacterium]|nr:hypothetical protein [Solirubrobacteraceae bacterium]
MAGFEDQASERLTLRRETLRDLQPDDEQTAAVRGGNHSAQWTNEWSLCDCPVAPMLETTRTWMLPRTIRGTVTLDDGERRVTVTYDLHPAEEISKFLEGRGGKGGIPPIRRPEE